MPLVAPLVGLGVYTLVLFVIALALLIAVIMGYIAGVLSGLPWPIDKLAGPVSSLAQGISHVCGVALGKVDSLAGAAWHAMARYLDKTWEQMEAQAHLAWTQTEILAGHIYDVTGLRAAVKSITHSFRGIEHGVKDLEHWALREERRIKRLEHALFHGIGEDVLPRLKTLEHEYEHIQNKELTAIRREWATTEGELTALQKWITANIPLVGTDAFVAAITATLGALGLGALSCRNFKNLLGKFGCGLGTLLNDLLGLVIAGLVLESVCEFLPYFEDAFGAVVGPITHLLTEVPLGDCETFPDGWTKLNVATGPLPPPQSLGTFSG